MHFVYVICSFFTNKLFDGWRAVIINNPIIMILTNQRFQLNVIVIDTCAMYTQKYMKTLGNSHVNKIE